MMSDYYLVRLSYQYGMLVRVKDVVKTWSRDARSIYVHHFLRQSYYQHYHLRLNTLTRICIESCYCRLKILLHYNNVIICNSKAVFDVKFTFVISTSLEQILILYDPQP